MTTPSTGSGPEEIKPNPGSGKNNPCTQKGRRSIPHPRVRDIFMDNMLLNEYKHVHVFLNFISNVTWKDYNIQSFMYIVNLKQFVTPNRT